MQNEELYNLIVRETKEREVREKNGMLTQMMKNVQFQVKKRLSDEVLKVTVEHSSSVG